MIHSASENLAQDIKNRIKEERKAGASIPYSNIYAMGSVSTVDSVDFNELKSVEGETRAFIFSVNPEEIIAFYKENRENPKMQQKIDIGGMLLLGFEAAIGNPLPAQKKFLSFQYDPVGRILYLTPKPEKMDYQKLVDENLGEAKAFRSA